MLVSTVLHPTQHILQKQLLFGVPLAGVRALSRLKLGKATKTCGSAEGLPAAGEIAPKVIIVTGPTAVGKTAVGLQLAKLLGGEIISADSVQVYKTLDIGSDKLPVSQRDGIPHHLIDVKEPCDEFSAGEFYELAREAARDILQRGRVPIVVGGTGLYLKWFVYGRAQTPKATPETIQFVKTAVQQAWSTAVAPQDGAVGDDERWLAAAELLRTWGDSEAYERIVKERMNYYRLERALCIVHQTGKRLRDMDVDSSASAPLDYDMRCFFLYRGRLQLWDRIALRIEEMVFSGLLDEASMLLELGVRPGVNMASRAIGYRQAMEFLMAVSHSALPVTGPQVIQLIHDVENATHRLVRSQMTWFRDDATYKWLDVSDGNTAAAVDTILSELQKAVHEGGCSDDSGRLSKQEQKVLNSHRPPLKLAKQASHMGPLLEHLNTRVLPALRDKLPPPDTTSQVATEPPPPAQKMKNREQGEAKRRAAAPAVMFQPPAHVDKRPGRAAEIEAGLDGQQSQAAEMEAAGVEGQHAPAVQMEAGSHPQARVDEQQGRAAGTDAGVDEQFVQAAQLESRLDGVGRSGDGVEWSPTSHDSATGRAGDSTTRQQQQQPEGTSPSEPGETPAGVMPNGHREPKAESDAASLSSPPKHSSATQPHDEPQHWPAVAAAAVTAVVSGAAAAWLHQDVS